MIQRIAAISTIICIGLFAGMTFARPAFAQTSVMAPQPAKLLYHVMGILELAKLADSGDAAALRELEKRYGSQVDKSAAENTKKAHDPNAPVLGTSKGLGVLPPKFKDAQPKVKASTSKKFRSIAEITKDIDELEAKVIASLAKIKAGTYSAADKRETAKTLKRLKEVQAEYKIKKLTDAVGHLKKSTKIVGETAEVIKKNLTFVWTMKPAELKALAEKGDAEAQVEIARRYDDGKRGFEKDAIASFQWMLKASDGGFAIAQSYTASHYFYGEGVAKNDTKAVYWLQKSAENGYKFAQFQLHKEYEEYFGLSGWKIFPKDLAKAKYWLDKAIAQGFELAILHKEQQHPGE